MLVRRKKPRGSFIFGNLRCGNPLWQSLRANVVAEHPTAFFCQGPDTLAAQASAILSLAAILTGVVVLLVATRRLTWELRRPGSVHAAL
jgi:hypothetical protein